MDVTNCAPFSNVECPSCQKHTRVKREFGPYTLLRRHAIGGMSMVFVGHDNTLDREVALKILSETYSADEKRITAFEEEARITAAISHPHVVRVFKTGKSFGRFYIAMELVAGGHLEHQIKERGAIPETEALKLAIQVAEGLSAAHTAGLIHRDIKPGNILLDSAGSAKIVDFGLALMTKGGVAKPDELWATPYYVPPETVDGLEEDYRADVYAFGATFYHVLAGKPPCTEESMVTSQLREAKKHITPLSIACPQLCMETSAVIECAMAYDPGARFTSYDELIDSLQTALMVAQTREKNIRKGIPHTSATAPKGITAADRRIIAKQRSKQKAVTSLVILLALGAAIWGASVLLNKPTVTTVVNDPSAPAPVEPITTDSSGVEIGSLYQRARTLQQNGDYEAAHESFVALRDNSKVQEPTRTWCAFEAMLGSFLNGRTSAAQADAKALADHLNTPAAPKNFKNRLSGWLEKIQQLPPIPQAIPSEKPDTDQLWQMSTMASACKNWEQGRFTTAQSLFETLVKTVKKDPNNLTGLYITKAEEYLADATLLTTHQLGELPNTIAECRETVAKLNEVIPTLKTRGRAKFQVREWQLLLEKQAKNLEKQPATPSTENVSFASAFVASVKLVQQCRYLDAAELLKKSHSAVAAEETSRIALVGICESAGLFLADLESDLKKELVKSPSKLAIKAKDQRSFSEISGAGDGTVTVKNGDAEATLPWSQFDTLEVINIYRSIVRPKISASTALAIRDESAIAYQWLSGDKEAANSAAKVLSESSPTFQTRWSQWMAVLNGAK